MKVQNQISIAIIEDQKEIAFGLRDVLNSTEKLICRQIYHNAEDALVFLPKSIPNIVLVDIGLPGISGIQLIQEMSDQLTDTAFCMFTVFEDDEKIFKSLKAGATGYILKNSNSESIIKSLLELYNGGSPISPLIARKIVRSFSSDSVNTNLPLSSREYEILALLSRGNMYKEIASELHLTVGSVKQHVHRIYKKLQVNNRMAAIEKFKKRF